LVGLFQPGFPAPGWNGVIGHFPQRLMLWPKFLFGRFLGQPGETAIPVSLVPGLANFQGPTQKGPGEFLGLF